MRSPPSNPLKSICSAAAICCRCGKPGGAGPRCAACCCREPSCWEPIGGARRLCCAGGPGCNAGVSACEAARLLAKARKAGAPNPGGGGLGGPCCCAGGRKGWACSCGAGCCGALAAKPLKAPPDGRPCDV